MDYGPGRSYIEMRSAGMAVASLVMGILGIALSCCIYPAFIFGSLAVIFALLSRGGEMKPGGKGKIGLSLGVLALIFGVLFLLYGILTIYVQFGGIEGYMEYLNEVLQQLGSPDASAPYSEPYPNPYSNPYSNPNVDPYSFFEGF